MKDNGKGCQQTYSSERKMTHARARHRGRVERREREEGEKRERETRERETRAKRERERTEGARAQETRRNLNIGQFLLAQEEVWHAVGYTEFVANVPPNVLRSTHTHTHTHTIMR